MLIKQTSKKIVGYRKEKKPKWFDTVYDESGNIIQEGHYEDVEVDVAIVKDVTEEVEVDETYADHTQPTLSTPTNEERIEALENALLEMILKGGAL